MIELPESNILEPLPPGVRRRIIALTAVEAELGDALAALQQQATNQDWQVEAGSAEAVVLDDGSYVASIMVTSLLV